MFKAGGHWIFKHFFDDREIFRELADHYNKDLYRFEFKTIGERNKALKLLEMRGFDVDLVEDLKGYAVKLPRHSRYAAVPGQLDGVPLPVFQPGPRQSHASLGA